MAKLEQKVERVLQDAFPTAWVNVEPMHGGRLAGEMTWKGFARMKHLNRQRMVSAALERGLTKREKLEVAVVLAFTPTEWKIMKEEAALAL